jgi:hypothetical protein
MGTGEGGGCWDCGGGREGGVEVEVGNFGGGFSGSW